MKKFIPILILFTLSTAKVYTQEEEYFSGDENNKDKKEKTSENKWLFGGDLSLNFGTYTYIEVSPIAGYRFSDRLIAGPGFIFQYLNYKPYHYETMVYGARAFGLYSLVPDLNEKIGINLGDLVFYSENQLTNQDTYNIDNNQLFSEGRKWIDNFLVGGGFFQNIGNRGGGLLFLVLFDITQNQYSSYSNPIIKIGVMF
jgi:hypothetical protein